MVVQNTYGMGYFGVESAYKLLAGQGSSVEKSNDHRHPHHRPRENMFAMDKPKGPVPVWMTLRSSGPYEPTVKALLPLSEKGLFYFSITRKNLTK